MTDAKKPEAETPAREMSEAEIDQNLEDTFPASDPPSWTLGTNHVEDSRVEPDNESSGASNETAAENPKGPASSR